MEKPRHPGSCRAGDRGLGDPRGGPLGSVTTSSPRSRLAGRILYGSVFAMVLPGLLAAWAHATRGLVHGPALHDPRNGALIAAAGVLIVVAGMAALWTRGGGLPMNAFPPPRFVAEGMYAAVPHPIYGGFVIACAGVAVFTGSASGLWLVTPAV